MVAAIRATRRRRPRPPVLHVGQPVSWLRTPGGGGGSGHRVMEKEPVSTVVLALTPRSVRIALSRGPTWVRRANVVPR